MCVCGCVCTPFLWLLCDCVRWLFVYLFEQNVKPEQRFSQTKRQHTPAILCAFFNTKAPNKVRIIWPTTASVAQLVAEQWNILYARMILLVCFSMWNKTGNCVYETLCECCTQTLQRTHGFYHTTTKIGTAWHGRLVHLFVRTRICIFDLSTKAMKQKNGEVLFLWFSSFYITVWRAHTYWSIRS